MWGPLGIGGWKGTGGFLEASEKKSLSFLEQTVEIRMLESASEVSGRGEERGKLILPYIHILCRMLLEI